MKSEKSGMDVGEELRQQAHLRRIIDELNGYREYHTEQAKNLGCSPELSAAIAYLVKKGIL
jgi:succinyl-CoA synthetase beta subunit